MIKTRDKVKERKWEKVKEREQDKVKERKWEKVKERERDKVRKEVRAKVKPKALRPSANRNGMHCSVHICMI